MPMRIDEISDRVEHLDRRSHDLVWGEEVRLPLSDVRWLFNKIAEVVTELDDGLQRTAKGNIKGTVGHMLEISDQVGDRLSLEPERTGLLDKRDAWAEDQARESLMDDDFSRG